VPSGVAPGGQGGGQFFTDAEVLKEIVRVYMAAASGRPDSKCC